MEQFGPFEMPSFQEILKISAQEKIGLEKVADVFREQLDSVAMENEVLSGGPFLSPEQKEKRLRFELSHKFEYE